MDEDQLFVRFFRANNVRGETDFKGRRRLYSFAGSRFLKEQLLSSIDFAGFCDGYQEREPKFQFKHRTLDTICIGGIGVHPLTSYRLSSEDITKHDEHRYARQYYLGLVLRQDISN